MSAHSLLCSAALGGKVKVRVRVSGVSAHRLKCY